jgi:hypothetical protein
MTDRAMPSPALADIVGDVALLHDAYHKGTLISDGPGTDLARKLVGDGQDIFRFRRLFLLLDALLRNRIGRLIERDDGLRHVVVFGGNNVGKSTIINILAGRRVASVSPEGGHTRHAEAFVPRAAADKLFGPNPYAFCRLTPHTNGGLAQAPLDRYGISPLVSDVLPENVVLWDTPDCDAVGSESYLVSVIEAVAAADVLVYVTSGEKYSVEHLVEWFLLLHGTGIDMLECLNRTAVRDHARVIESQRTRFLPRAAAALGVAVPDPRVVGLKFMVEGEEEDLWDPRLHPEAEKLRREVLTLLDRRDRPAEIERTLDFVRRHVDAILEPARMETAAIAGWANEVDDAVRLFATVYEQEYLTSDKTIDPISRLNVQILELLNPDIPGLQQALTALSWAARWPAKITIKAIGHIYQAVTGAQKSGKHAPKELVAYTDAHTAVLTRLSAAIEAAREEPRHHPFWDALDAAWKDEFDGLNDRFVKLVANHMEETDRAIVATAAQIIEHLRSRPTLLKALQSARVAATVGGIAVSFTLPHAGTFAYNLLEESVLGPVMAVCVDTATQGAIAAFVKKCEADLITKLKQEAAANALILYGEAVNRIAEVAKMRAGTLGLDPAVLRRLPEELRKLASSTEALPARIA